MNNRKELCINHYNMIDIKIYEINNNNKIIRNCKCNPRFEYNIVFN